MPQARLATAGDLALVISLTREAYAEYDAVLDAPPLPVTEDYAPRIAAGQVWIVSTDGADQAAIVLETEPGHMLVFSLAVRPAAQGRGLGRWLLSFAEERARAASLAEIRLYTNARMARNIEIYRKAGYHETGRRPNPYRPGWIMVDMSKAL